MIIQEKELILTVCQDYLRNYCTYITLSRMHETDRQDFKMILVHLNAHAFHYRFHDLIRNDTVIRNYYMFI